MLLTQTMMNNQLNEDHIGFAVRHLPPNVEIGVFQQLLPLCYDDPQVVVNAVANDLIALMLYKAKTPPRTPLPLRERAALEELRSILLDSFDEVEMERLSFLKNLIFSEFYTPQAHWYTLQRCYDIFKNPSPIKSAFVTLEHNDTREAVHYTWPHLKSLTHASDFDLAKDSVYPLRITDKEDLQVYVETRRSILLEDGHCIFLTNLRDDLPIHIVYDPNDLLRCGDVELNPGPTTQSKPVDKEKEQRKQISLLQKEISKLRRAHARHANYVQRQLELEKRDRNRNRVQNADTKYAQGFRSFTNNLGTVAQDAATYVGPSLQMIHEAISSLASSANSLGKLFHIPAGIDVLSILLCLASIADCVMKKNLILLALHVAQLSRLLHVDFDSLSSMFNSAMTCATTEVDSHKDSPTDTKEKFANSYTNVFAAAKEATTLGPITGVLACFVSVFNLMCVGKVPSPSNIAQHFTSIGRAAQGFKSIKDLLTWIFDYLAEIYYRTLYGMSTEEYAFIKLYPDLSDIHAAIEIVSKVDVAVINGSAPLADQILGMKQRLEKYLVQAAQTKSVANQGIIRTMLTRFKTQYEAALTSCARQKTIRKEPTAIYLQGYPGVGKTVLTNVLKAKIFEKYLSKDYQYQNCCFSRKTENDYWEGYYGQPIVELDDFGNKRDSSSNPCKEYFEFEYMVNTADYPLNMATLTSKGTTNFTSDFILASANALYPDIKSLTDPNAVYRRFAIWAQVSIDPAFGKKTGKDANGVPYYKFDINATAAHLKCNVADVNPLHTDHYRFDIYTVEKNYQTGATEVRFIPSLKGLTFTQFWNHFVDVRDGKATTNDKLTAAIQELAGIKNTESAPHIEREILDKLDAIFNPTELVSKIAEDPSNNDKLYGDDLNHCKESDDLVSANLMQTQLVSRKKILLESFKKIRAKFAHSLKTSLQHMADTLKGLSGKLAGVAGFFLSAVGCMAGKAYSFLPTVSIPKILVGVFVTLTTLFGIWYSGIFRSDSRPASIPHCKFNTYPSYNTSPCGLCNICKTLDYPDSGDMVDHYLSRVEIPQVREDLEYFFITDHEIAANTNRLWREKVRVLQEETQEQAVQTILDRVFAERAYDSQPTVPKRAAYAQRVYDNQPNVPKKPSYAQGKFTGNVVECKTEMHIGARKFAQRDLVRVEQTTQTLLNNAVWIQVRNKDNFTYRCNGVFLVGRTLITTAHSILDLPPDFDTIVLRNPYATTDAIAIPLSACQISQVKQLDGLLTDLVLISFPPTVPNRPRIINRFVDANDIGSLSEGTLVLSGFSEAKGQTIVQEKHAARFSVNTRATSYLLHPTNCPTGKHCTCTVNIGNHIDYDLDTTYGMCGALVSVSNKLVNKKLIGFHVAGGAQSSTGVLVTQQLLLSALDDHVTKFSIPASYVIDGRLPYAQSWIDPSHRARLLDEGDCLNIGKAPAPATPTQTQLSPSLVFDQVQQHTTEPALLTKTVVDGIVVDPMIKGIKKIMGPQVWIDPELLQAAANDVFACVGLPDTGVGIVHTLEEAIVGVEGDPYKRSINRSTSPGYPYNLNNKAKGKTQWMGSDDHFIVDHPELVHDVNRLLDDSSKGIRGSAISLATLKDEKRPIAKVHAGKTRVFEACPQHLVVAMRMYFLDFAAHVMRRRIDNGIAVGINPYSLEWTRLANHLLKQGNYMVAGDFSNFDGSLLMQVLVTICDHINKWYNDGEENALIRSALWEHICNADVLVQGEVVRQTHSQPSGNPLTVIINSLFNGIIMRVAYLKLKMDQGLPMVCDYTKHVSEIIYGDDDIKSVHISILNWFNQTTITDALAGFGLTYTDETKTGNARPWKTLEETAFLKRSFVRDRFGVYSAPMPIGNILEMTNWIKGKHLRAATLSNCSQALFELALHPEPEYEYWSNRIRRACHTANLDLRVPTYNEQLAFHKYESDRYTNVEYAPLW